MNCSSNNIGRLAQFLAVLLILGLSGCVSSFVKDLLISSVKITPANPTIAVGATQQFSLVVTYVDGQTDHPTPSSTAWSSDDATVATISKAGLATALAAGTANIGGSYHGNDTTTVLTVTAVPADVAIAVRGDSRVLCVTNLRTGQQMTFAANGLGDSVTISSGGDSSAAAEVSVLPQHGPAWLAIAPSGKYLYVLNQTSESVSAFAIDWKVGVLQPVVSSPFPAGAKPSSIEVGPDGAVLSVAHLQEPKVSRFLIDPATGALTTDPN
ncbi:MAG: beta-propeller fold lactonase family protein [Candidatus Acidiferrales bacterium]